MIQQNNHVLLLGHNAPISVKLEGGGDRATHGNLTVTYIPRVGILIGHHVPMVGNFGMVTILDNSRKEVHQLLLFCNFAVFSQTAKNKHTICYSSVIF